MIVRGTIGFFFSRFFFLFFTRLKLGLLKSTRLVVTRFLKSLTSTRFQVSRFLRNSQKVLGFRFEITRFAKFVKKVLGSLTRLSIFCENYSVF